MLQVFNDIQVLVRHVLLNLNLIQYLPHLFRRYLSDVRARRTLNKFCVQRSVVCDGESGEVVGALGEVGEEGAVGEGHGFLGHNLEVARVLVRATVGEHRHLTERVSDEVEDP